MVRRWDRVCDESTNADHRHSLLPVYLRWMFKFLLWMNNLIETPRQFSHFPTYLSSQCFLWVDKFDSPDVAFLIHIGLPSSESIVPHNVSSESNKHFFRWCDTLTQNPGQHEYSIQYSQVAFFSIFAPKPEMDWRSWTQITLMLAAPIPLV